MCVRCMVKGQITICVVRGNCTTTQHVQVRSEYSSLNAVKNKLADASCWLCSSCCLNAHHQIKLTKQEAGVVGCTIRCVRVSETGESAFGLRGCSLPFEKTEKLMQITKTGYVGTFSLIEDLLRDRQLRLEFVTGNFRACPISVSPNHEYTVELYRASGSKGSRIVLILFSISFCQSEVHIF